MICTSQLISLDAGGPRGIWYPLATTVPLCSEIWQPFDSATARELVQSVGKMVLCPPLLGAGPTQGFRKPVETSRAPQVSSLSTPPVVLLPCFGAWTAAAAPCSSSPLYTRPPAQTAPGGTSPSSAGGAICFLSHWRQTPWTWAGPGYPSPIFYSPQAEQGALFPHQPLLMSSAICNLPSPPLSALRCSSQHVLCSPVLSCVSVTCPSASILPRPGTRWR